MRASLFALAALAMAGWASSASAASSCSAHHQTCIKYCQDTYKKTGGGGCTRGCAEALPKCMSTGCWVNSFAHYCGLQKS
jgi:hypothetical protein